MQRDSSVVQIFHLVVVLVAESCWIGGGRREKIFHKLFKSFLDPKLSVGPLSMSVFSEWEELLYNTLLLLVIAGAYEPPPHYSYMYVHVHVTAT